MTETWSVTLREEHRLKVFGEIFQRKFVEEIKINISCSINSFPKIMPFLR